MQDLDPSDICKKKFLNPLKRIRVIIRTPTHGRTDGRTDRQTDRRTDEQGESSIPPPPNFVAGGIIINQDKVWWKQKSCIKLWLIKVENVYMVKSTLHQNRWETKDKKQGVINQLSTDETKIDGVILSNSSLEEDTDVSCLWWKQHLCVKWFENKSKLHSIYHMWVFRHQAWVGWHQYINGQCHYKGLVGFVENHGGLKNESWN